MKTKAHAVCVPAPYQSHISAMLKLAKLLHSNGGFHITFVNTEFNHRRLLKSIDGFPGFQFRSISDGLPPSDEDKNQDVLLLCESIENYMSVPFTELLKDLNDESAAAAPDKVGAVPPVSCVVSDGFMSIATDLAAEKLGVPIVYFWTISAFAHLGFRQFRALKDRGLTPLKDINDFTHEYLNTTIDWIPEMPNMKLKDLPDAFQITDPDDFLFNFTMKASERFRASAAVFNTFDALEPDVLNVLATIYPKVYAIGPLQSLLDRTGSVDDHLKPLGHNLLKEDTECLKWLDRQNPRSVIYVNFGSLITLTQEQLLEFGLGLANSRKPFLWIIRPDVVEGDKDLLDSGFFEKTKERGMIVDWCPQEEVLSHVAVGVFLTHCGWNSVLESITAGVPMICWPKIWDQRSNSSSCCEWGVGVEMESEVNRDGVERIVREVMEGDKGLEMKERAMELRKLAEQATGEYGSSSVNLQRLIKDVLLM